MNDITLVTGLYNLNREVDGDGRKMTDYVTWLKKTMLLNAPMIIYCEKVVFEQIKNIRNEYQYTKYIIIEKQDIYYFKYEKKVNEINKSKEYLNKIEGKDRLEVKLPNYNLLIMNKIEWLNDVANNNIFNSTFFMWIDAGCSRFFNNYNLALKKEWPNINKLQKNKFNIQIKNNFFINHDIKDLIYHNDHLTTATIFSGTKNIINIMKEEVEKTFNYMLNNNCVNNEQIVFAIILKSNPELLYGFINKTHLHLPFFEYLSA